MQLNIKHTHTWSLDASPEAASKWHFNKGETTKKYQLFKQKSKIRTI